MSSRILLFALALLWSTQPVAQDTRSPPPRVQPAPAPPPDYTVWHGVLGMIAPTNSNLTISRGTSGNTLIVGSQTVADLQWLYLPLAAPDNVKIKSITLCYSVDNARSFVSQIRLTQETVPPTATVVHDDGTDLTSTVATCSVSNVGNFQANGAVTVGLRLNFANTADRIRIGAIGVKFGY